MNKLSERIFDAEKIENCTQRMAYQIYESTYGVEKLFLVGIAKNGSAFAAKLRDYLEKISPVTVETYTIHLDKENPLNSVKGDFSMDQLNNQSVVIIDDVLNTGSTLMYAVKYLLDVPLKQLKSAVLVNRNHKKYPIKADFKGLSLSTSISEHVEVILSGEKAGVYLR